MPRKSLPRDPITVANLVSTRSSPSAGPERVVAESQGRTLRIARRSLDLDVRDAARAVGCGMTGAVLVELELGRVMFAHAGGLAQVIDKLRAAAAHRARFAEKAR